MTTAAPSVVKPQALASGDAVAVVSPSWGGPGTVPRRFERGVRALREHLGVDVRLMPHTCGNRSWVSATPQQRADDLNAAFADPHIRAVLCSIGGDHSAQILDRIDYDAVIANPKIFCGYSDMTVLHHALHARTGLVTFYGPSVLAEWGEWPRPYDYTVEHFRRVTMRDEPLGVVRPPEFTVDEFLDWSVDETRQRERRPADPWLPLRHGRGRGPLLVGCLPSIRQLLGTAWQPDHRGRVLVVETPEMPYSRADADRDLWHLRNAGMLDDLAGLVLARPYQFDPDDIHALQRLTLDATEGRPYPVLFGVDCGHTDPMLTLPIGVPATVGGPDLSVEESAVTSRC